MNIKLRQIGLDDDLEGLEVLKKIAIENEEESPVPKEINEELYSAFLLIASEEANMQEGIPCIRYWICLDDKIIGYADIKKGLDEESKKVGGHIGLIILNEFQHKGIGLYVMRLLIDKAKNEFNIDDILVTTNPNNKSAIRLFEKLGAEYTDTDIHKHFHIRK